ncbi:MAG: type II secretion system protein M, partial [Lysobacteraceae bacterium]
MKAEALRARWAGLATREKTLVAAASGLVVLALAWWIAIAPALATLRSADEQHRLLDAQLEAMLRLQSQAKAMQAQHRLQ